MEGLPGGPDARERRWRRRIRGGVRAHRGPRGGPERHVGKERGLRGAAQPEDEDGPEEAADAREVDKPDGVGTLREELASATEDTGASARPGRALAERALDGRSRGPEPEPREDPRDAAGPPPRPLTLEAMRNLASEVGQPVHRRLRLDEARLIRGDLVTPVDDGLRGEDEGGGGRGDRESVAGAEDREALPRLVARPAARVGPSESRAQELERRALAARRSRGARRPRQRAGGHARSGHATCRGRGRSRGRRGGVRGSSEGG
jgi:hypothetical protein